jgi:hypothetical protein
MVSLTTHLRESGDHGRLAFHPDCPVCRRERLAGTLRADPIIGRRTQAALAVGVLALSTTTPASALAQGTVVPNQDASGDPASNPDFDPGGASSELPDEAAAPPPAGTADPTAGSDDQGPVEQEPATDDQPPVADAGDQGGTLAPDQQQAPELSDPATAPPAAPPQPAAQAPTQTTPAPAPANPTPTPTATPAPSATPTPTEPREQNRQRDKPRHKPRPYAQSEPLAPEPAPQPTTAPATASAPSAVEETVATAAAATAPPSGQRARPGERSHVVLPGESLWSIADDMLGDKVSVARIAREVNRLWQLNSPRIATGDPNLLRVGTRLTLR